MMADMLEKVVESQLKKDVPQFNVGDTVDVHVKIVEGDRERVQVFNGTVLARKGRGINETFTVRRIVSGRSSSSTTTGNPTRLRRQMTPEPMSPPPRTTTTWSEKSITVRLQMPN